MNSTQLVGPYDHLPVSEKLLITAAIPPDVKARLFEIQMPRRGACDKVLCRILASIDVWISLHREELQELCAPEPVEYEDVVNTLLNKFTQLLVDTNAKDL